MKNLKESERRKMLLEEEKRRTAAEFNQKTKENYEKILKRKKDLDDDKVHNNFYLG